MVKTLQEKHPHDVRGTRGQFDQERKKRDRFGVVVTMIGFAIIVIGLIIIGIKAL